MNAHRSAHSCPDVIVFSKILFSPQTEWYEMKKNGQLNPEDIGVMGDLYKKNESLDDQVKQLRRDVENSLTVADKAKNTWDKFRKERDFHRMHHRRVVQEKNTLIKDMKRLKKHFSTYEPALKKMRSKYETAMKEKMLMRLERDRIRSKCEVLEQQVKAMEQSSLDAMGGAGAGIRPSGSDASDRSERKSRNNKENMKNKSNKKSKTPGSTRKKKKSKGPDTPFPSDDRINPHIDIKYDPIAVDDLQLRKTFKGHQMAISAMALHPKKPIVATVSDDMAWKLWSIPKGDLIMSGHGHKDWISNCDFHPRGTVLTTCSGDSTVKLWDITKAACSATLVDHTQAVWDVAFHDSGDFLVSASMDHTARLWDAHTGKCRQTFRGHVDSVNGVCFQPYSNMLCTASGDKTVSLWDLRSGLCIQVYGHNNAVVNSSFNIRGDSIVSSDSDGVVKIFDVRAAEERLEIATCLPNERIPINQAQFDRSGEVIATASDSGQVQMFASKDGEMLAMLNGHENAVQSVLFDPRGQYLLSGGSDATFRLWS